MKTRWGSCSPGGRMSFNWRLMLAPADVLETVVWHEVCHIEEPNHSKKFWALMDKRRPGHREHAQWLADNAPSLVLAPGGGSPAEPADEAPRVESPAAPAPQPATGDAGEQLRLVA